MSIRRISRPAPIDDWPPMERGEVLLEVWHHDGAQTAFIASDKAEADRVLTELAGVGDTSGWLMTHSQPTPRLHREDDS